MGKLSPILWRLLDSIFELTRVVWALYLSKLHEDTIVLMDAKHSISSSQEEFLDFASQVKYVFIINSSLLSGRVRTRAWTRQCSDLTTLMYFLRCLLIMKLRPPLALPTRLSESLKEGELITELLGNALLILYRLCLSRKCS